MAQLLKATERETLALGWLSAHLATAAKAWGGGAPAWFPEPPEWLELWSKALRETASDRSLAEGSWIVAKENETWITLAHSDKEFRLAVPIGFDVDAKDAVVVPIYPCRTCGWTEACGSCKP